MFTVGWQAPSGTSLPYLTFYNDSKYTNDWLWVKPEASDTVRIGFTEYAQMAIGSIWFLNPMFTGAGFPGRVCRNRGVDEYMVRHYSGAFGNGRRYPERVLRIPFSKTQGFLIVSSRMPARAVLIIVHLIASMKAWPGKMGIIGCQSSA